MESSKMNGLGDVWTSKHSNPFLFFIPSLLILPVFLAVKGITYNNLIRLGIVWGKGPGAYEKGIFGQSWGCHTEHVIRELYSSVCKKLKELPFRPFDTLTLLIGDKNAREFYSKDRLNHTIRPPIPPNPSPSVAS